MDNYERAHLSDGTLLGNLTTHLANERANTAVVLADIAEVDLRKLYLQAGHPSMFAFCVGELHFCEQAAYKRICAARAARKCSGIFTAVAEGRLHLSAVVLLAPHLTCENCDDLIRAATHRTKAQIEELLARRFPRPDVPDCLRRLPIRTGQLSSGIVQEPKAIEFPTAPETVELASPDEVTIGQLSPGIVAGAPSPAVPAAAPARIKPLAPQRFALQLTIGQSTHDKLRYAQALLSHQVASGNVAQVLDRALDALIGQLERRKFAATSRPRQGRPKAGGTRHVPADVKRTVWRRDGGRCTFVSDTGRRCEAHTLLEYDHIHPVARGGRSTVGGMRLRCRAHNQYEAERAFGAAFMNEKRRRTRLAPEDGGKGGGRALERIRAAEP